MEQNYMDTVSKFHIPKRITQICNAIRDAGGTVYITGGAVRDHLLHNNPKDIDIEVHCLEPDKLDALLHSFGNVKAVGKSFGIWKLKQYIAEFNNEEIELDITIPQIESQPAPHIGIVEACKRRDLRINAIVYDVCTEEFIDPHNGIEDIQQKILRATDETEFARDPLRVFRVAQFAGRFEFSVAPALEQLCQSIDVSKIAVERVFLELNKAFLKSQNPSIAFHVLHRTGALTRYFTNPPLYTKDNIERIPMLFDRIPRFMQDNAQIYGLDTFENDRLEAWKIALFWSVLLHNHSPEEKEAIFDQLKTKRYANFSLVDAVIASSNHQPALSMSTNTIAQNFASTEISVRFLCIYAHILAPEGHAMHNLEQAIQRDIADKPIPALLQGTDIQHLVSQPKHIGQTLKHVRHLQLQDSIHTAKEALQIAKEYISTIV